MSSFIDILVFTPSFTPRLEEPKPVTKIEIGRAPFFPDLLFARFRPFLYFNCGIFRRRWRNEGFPPKEIGENLSPRSRRNSSPPFFSPSFFNQQTVHNVSFLFSPSKAWLPFPRLSKLGCPPLIERKGGFFSLFLLLRSQRTYRGFFCPPACRLRESCS